MTEKKNEQTIKSLMLPLINKTIIIPNANIAEIVSLLTVEKGGDHYAKGLLGMAPWRGHTIPVVSLEHMAEELDESIDMARANYAVFYSLMDNSKYPFYALLMQGVPRFEQASEEAIKDVDDKDMPDFFVKRGLLADKDIYVPNLDKIEATLNAL